MTAPDAIDWTKNWLNDTFQNKGSNKDGNGNYKDFFFGDVFDARTGNIYRVFSDACKDKYSMDKLNFTVLDKSEFAKNSDVIEIAGVQLNNTNRIISLENNDNTTEAVVI